MCVPRLSRNLSIVGAARKGADGSVLSIGDPSGVPEEAGKGSILSIGDLGSGPGEANLTRASGVSYGNELDLGELSLEEQFR